MLKAWDYNKENENEMWDIFNKDRVKLPYQKKRKEQLEDNEYHLVVRVWIINSDKDILISQRGKQKRGPLLWECTAGSALSGEGSRETINREVMEELGIDLSKDQGIKVVDTRRDANHDFYEVWIYRKDVKLEDVCIDGEEVIDVKWISLTELENMIKNNEIMPTLSNFPAIYRKYILNEE